MPAPTIAQMLQRSKPQAAMASLPLHGSRLPRRLATWLLVGAGTTLLASCSSPPRLNGAGASFPAPIYQRWFQQLASKGIQVNYQSVGSGAGVRQFLAGTVDFGASDVPLSAAERSKAPQGVVQLPLTAGAIALAYNLPGCALSLSQDQLVGIFQGRITNFSQLGCAPQPITVVYRSDGSGTTSNFTAHLAAISPAWAKSPGQGKLIAWPSGIGAKGNEGVAAQLRQLRGGIGYLEASFVNEPLQAAALSNASGQRQRPGVSESQAALAAIQLDKELVGREPNPRQGYPIVSFTWVLLPERISDPAKLETFRRVFGFTLSNEAQAIAPSLGYITLPESVLQRGREALAQRLR